LWTRLTEQRYTDVDRGAKTATLPDFTNAIAVEKSLDHAETKANYINVTQFDSLEVFDGGPSALRNWSSSPGQRCSARCRASSRVGASTVPRAAGLDRPGRPGTGAANTIHRIVRPPFLGNQSRESKSAG
jgi:hypothetical protein